MPGAASQVPHEQHLKLQEELRKLQEERQLERRKHHEERRKLKELQDRSQQKERELEGVQKQHAQEVDALRAGQARDKASLTRAGGFLIEFLKESCLREREAARKRLQAACYELGNIVVHRSGPEIREGWEDGQLFADLKTRMQEVEMERKQCDDVRLPPRASLASPRRRVALAALRRLALQPTRARARRR